MENRIKFFDETFKALLAVSVSAWILYIILVFFITDDGICVPSGSPSGIFTVGAYLVSILSALPIIYGLVRMAFWPNGPKSKSVYVTGWIMSILASLFIVFLILFALGMSQFGCQ